MLKYSIHSTYEPIASSCTLTESEASKYMVDAELPEMPSLNSCIIIPGATAAISRSLWIEEQSTIMSTCAGPSSTKARHLLGIRSRTI
jgi:hypothetical protein